jgi:nucleolar complex protein 2
MVELMELGLTHKQQRSLRALRKLLVAFRSAAHIQNESESKVELAWRIDSPASKPLQQSLIFTNACLAVFRKLVVTALRYTPVILDHHIPYKTLPNGKLYA